MNALTMMTLAVLVPGAGADTENADVWVRMTFETIEVASTPEAAARMQTESEVEAGTVFESVMVKCKSLKTDFNADGNLIECESCSFTTGRRFEGTAPLAIFDQAKCLLTLKGDETTPVEIVIHPSDKQRGRKIVTNKSVSFVVLSPNRYIDASWENRRLLPTFTLNSQLFDRSFYEDPAKERKPMTED